MLVDKRIYTEIMDKTGASSAIISRVSRVLGADDSVLRALLEADKAAGPKNLSLIHISAGHLRVPL